MFASEISNEQLHDLPLVRFSGKIHLIESQCAAEGAIGRLTACPVLGFDTETRPSFTKGKVNKVALLQLATNTDAYLFRICKMDTPCGLMDLLANPRILKIGVAIKNDIFTLRRSDKVYPQGFVDLQDMAKRFAIKNISLAKMAGIVLNARISKSQQLSNWEHAVLTEAQQYYAATDAWICYEIYRKLTPLLQSLQA